MKFYFKLLILLLFSYLNNKLLYKFIFLENSFNKVFLFTLLNYIKVSYIVKNSL